VVEDAGCQGLASDTYLEESPWSGKCFGNEFLQQTTVMFVDRGTDLGHRSSTAKMVEYFLANTLPSPLPLCRYLYVDICMEYGYSVQPDPKKRQRKVTSSQLTTRLELDLKSNPMHLEIIIVGIRNPKHLFHCSLHTSFCKKKLSSTQCNQLVDIRLRFNSSSTRTRRRSYLTVPFFLLRR
jgi:hypothetical protein